MLRAQLCQATLKDECLVECLANELLDHIFAPGREGVTVETTAKSFGTREAHAVNLARSVVQNCDSGVPQDAGHVILPATFKVVITENGDNGNAARRVDILG